MLVQLIICDTRDWNYFSVYNAVLIILYFWLLIKTSVLINYRGPFEKYLWNFSPSYLAFNLIYKLSLKYWEHNVIQGDVSSPKLSLYQLQQVKETQTSKLQSAFTSTMNDKHRFMRQSKEKVSSFLHCSAPKLISKKRRSTYWLEQGEKRYAICNFGLQCQYWKLASIC